MAAQQNKIAIVEEYTNGNCSNIAVHTYIYVYDKSFCLRKF